MRVSDVVMLVLVVAAALATATVQESNPSLTATVEEQPATVQGSEPNLITNQTSETTKVETNNPNAKPTEESGDATKKEDSTRNEAKLESDKKSEAEETKVKYEGMKVLRVVVQNKDQKKFLRELEGKGEISTWLGNGTAVDILVKKDAAIDNIKKKQLSYDVVIEDVQKAIDEENPQLSEDEMSELEGRKVESYSHWERAILSGGRGNRFSYLAGNSHGWASMRKPGKKQNAKRYRLTWQQYHRMADIHGYLEHLVANYPNMVSLETIGRSVEGRPLHVLKISSGEPNAPGMWVDAGIHAREWITPATATYAISQIVEGGDGAQGIDWYFQPLVNPDGYEHSHRSDRLWRKNRANPEKGACAGTDLNRNFGYRWGGQGASRQPCRETYAGQGPFSEPETAAIKNYVTGKGGSIKAYVSLHSYGQYILYPWGYDRKVPPDYADLDRVGREMAQAMKKVGGQSYTVGSAASTLYPASGGSDDWAKGMAKVKYSYTLELRDTGRHGFVLPAQYIIPTAKEAYSALRTLAREVQNLK